jgi:hypothetical protein
VLASAVAGELGLTVLRSDGIRKELAGLPPGEGAAARFGEGIYTAEWTRRTYAEMLDRAAGLLARGQSVIADASFTAAWQRTAAGQAASDASADLVQLRCTASPDLAARRMGTRAGPGSDAGAGIARRMDATAEPWPDAQVIDTESGGTTGLPRECARKAAEAIRPHGPDYAWHPARPRILPG